MRAFFAILLGVLSFLVSSCATYHSRGRQGIVLDDYKIIYVINNLDDNRHVDQVLVGVLKDLGKEAQSGPETLIPDEADAVLTYRDQWSWDFADHLVSMDLALTETRKNRQVLATAHFTSPISFGDNLSWVCNRLVKKLLNAEQEKKTKK